LRANEWSRGLCDKKRVKCAECPSRRFLPVTEEVIRCHLSGQNATGRDFVMGVYPLLLDETCFFVATDFDKESWQEDAGAFMEKCRQLGLPAALERSRSGNGGHVWLFFTEPVPAVLARKLASHILTEAMEQRPEIGFRSYDRLIPNQVTLPRGGFGNLIALPLQNKPRARGNSVCVDRNFVAHEDQWGFLAGLGKISRSCIEEIARDAGAAGRIVGVRLAPVDEEDETPWRARPSPQGPIVARNGYFVLRFLAEDIGRYLDEVLDSIERALTNRSRGKVE
jgi:hypothetical protein